MRLALPSGQRIWIRPIRAADKLLLADGLERLSAESAYKRFLSAKPRLTSRELRYLTEVDMVDHVAFVAVREDRPDLVVGVGRWVREDDDPRAAEVAVVVADDLQGHGLGAALGRRLARAAVERGVERFTATMLPENRPAHRLFDRIAADLAAAAAEREPLAA